jgi:hypothetical protein
VRTFDKKNPPPVLRDVATQAPTPMIALVCIAPGVWRRKQYGVFASIATDK